MISENRCRRVFVHYFLRNIVCKYDFSTVSREKDIYIYVCVRVYVYACVLYIYIAIYTHIHVHIYDLGNIF